MLAHRALGTSLMLRGEFQACHDHTVQGAALYDPEQHGKLVLKFGQDPGVLNILYVAWSAWYLGFADEALERAEQAVELAQSLQHPLTNTIARTYLGLLHNYRGEYQRGSRLAEQAMDIAIQHGLALWQAMSKIEYGWALIGLGHRARGCEVIKEGVVSWKKTGAKSGLTFFLSSLAWGQWQSGALSDAMSTLDEIEELIAETDERFIEAELCRLRGEVTRLLGPEQASGAEAHFLRGLEIARAQHARAWELRLVTSLGRLWAERGETDRARRLIEPSLAGSTEGLDTADVKEARALLQSL
jgi:adenylate cyclase